MIARTKLQAQCVLGLMAGAPCFVMTGALSQTLNVPNQAVLSALHAVNNALACEPSFAVWISNKAGYGWHIMGRAADIERIERQCWEIIADDAAVIAADVKARDILIARSSATPSSLLGLGA